MEIARFSEFKTGTLVPIQVSDRLADFAFEPDPLPPRNWEPNLALWPLIVHARDRVSTLNGIGSVLPNPSLLLRPLQRREAIKSNSIEGTFVTPRELLLFEAERHEKEDDAGRKHQDWLEVALYDEAITSGCAKIEGGEAIDSRLIRDLHHMLLRSARGRNKNPGVFRDVQVYVDASRRYNPPPGETVGRHMDALVEYMNSGHGDPLVRAFVAHYQFEAIHPFKDGNGRMGRLLLSLAVYKWLGHSHAWLYLSEFFDHNRSEYIRLLFEVSSQGNWEEWVRFCLLGTVRQCDAAIDRCKKLNEVKAKYEQLVGKESLRMNAIIRKLLSSPFVSASQLEAELGVSYNTARADIDKLCAAGILFDMKTARPKRYCAEEIYHIAYDD